MIRPICKDMIILSQKSVPATKEDLQVLDDLLDTLRANAERCVGLAANMIGVNKRIIAFSIGPVHVGMINPVITKRSGAYEAEEGCLSLEGVRPATRYKSIEVAFLDRNFKQQKQVFSDFTAQIIQHEVDHCEGIII
ncbi:peptide deformylase [Paenibacillus sp. FSL R7-0273]|uniref:peptide deformylase n=1 Tax=Paenibacillus sp. FSL R7-0273 TaxID=1536772 RepID=UPI0004F5D5F0|nr:peptide deformylase [Paenibacillus sp. FSL R7-0273]AIQ46074.1 peptide deformylase [Paenibacillus sp. FSL R7-0273]OMF92798.1 peptide deformylase [Paenibacillus sp. FSL R7-0273]